MEYKVTIGGKEYILPTRTVEMDARIDGIEHLRQRIIRGDITRREGLAEEYAFVSDYIPEPLPPFEEIDIGDLECSALEIVSAYLRPDIEAQVNTLTSSIREVTNRKEVQELFRLQGIVNAQKRKRR